MSKNADHRLICVFSILCFGKLRETPYLGEGCQVHEFNSHSISVACEGDYHLTVPHTVQDVHTLLLDSVPNEFLTLELVHLPFRHLIIRDWDMSNYYRDVGSHVFTLNRHQSLSAISVHNLQAWNWADYEFEQIHIKKTSLTHIGSQRLNNILSKRLFSWRLLGLYIIECQLLSIDPNVFSHTLQLEVLDLSHNTLSGITTSSFPYTLHYLWSLDLSHNSLVTMDDDLFRRLPALKELNLSHNHLTTLPYDLMKPVWFHLKSFSLLDNPSLGCLSLCWSLRNESFPHPIAFDSTDCGHEYLKELTSITSLEMTALCLPKLDTFH